MRMKTVTAETIAQTGSTDVLAALRKISPSFSGSGNVVLTGYNETTHVYGGDSIALTVGATVLSSSRLGAGDAGATCRGARRRRGCRDDGQARVEGIGQESIVGSLGKQAVCRHGLALPVLRWAIQRSWLGAAICCGGAGMGNATLV